MSSIRTSRTRRVRLVSAAAGVVIAALSMSACKDGTGLDVTGAPVPASSASLEGGSSAEATSGGGASSTGGSSTGGSSTGGSSAGKASLSGGTSGSSSSGATGSTGAASGSSGSSASSGKKAVSPVTCEGSNTKTVAAPVNRPVNHMLITVTNTGSKPCFLYYYPAVKFTGAQAVPPVVEDSQPQAVVTLEPGQSGYAGVTLSATDGSGSNGRTVKNLDVFFYGQDLDKGSVGKKAQPKLPAGGVYIDDSLKVTYWQQELADALEW